MSDNIAFFFTGIILTLSLLRISVLLKPQLVIFILGLHRLRSILLGEQTTPTGAPLESRASPGKRSQLQHQALQPAKAFSLIALENFHAELDSRFARHQELLIQGNLKKSLRTLEFYVKQLNIRISEEGEIIIPLYKQNAPLPEKERNRSAEIYILEHRRYMNILREAADYIKELIMTGQPSEPRDILHVLELELRFKEMLQRHDGRELRDLYPGAEHNTTELERKAIWEQCFHKREEMGFRLGNLSTLTEEKIQLVTSNWNFVKEQFAEELIHASKFNDATLPFSSLQTVQGYKFGSLEIDFLSKVIDSLQQLDRDVIHRVRKQIPEECHREDMDEFIGVCLNALEKCNPKGSFTPYLREAWSNCLNVMLASADDKQESQI